MIGTAWGEHCSLHSCRSDFASERIPTLYEAVELCKELDLVMFLDAKDDNEEVHP